MQFPVPQFTDVEDRIIGPLTIKQFGIIFGAGIIIFLGYSATKSILVLIFLSVLFGVPAISLAFAKINGRPLYNTIGFFFRFLSSDKMLIFHKEAKGVSSAINLKDAAIANKKEDQQQMVKKSPSIQEIQKLLAETEARQKEINK